MSNFNVDQSLMRGNEEEVNSSPSSAAAAPISIQTGQNVNRLVGCRFCPKEYELIEYFLIRKIFDKPLPLSWDAIQEIDVYKSDPSELPISEYKHGYPGEAYYFTFSKRTTPNGYWKATGKEESVINRNKACLGFKKTLVFYFGNAPNGHKTDWIMHEYRANPSLFPHLQHSEEDLKLKVWHWQLSVSRDH